MIITQPALSNSCKVQKDLIRLRATTEKDDAFLLEVYASTRLEEMSLTGWPHEEIEEFLRMQFGLQHRQYRENYRNASFDLIFVKEKPVGRLYVDHGRDEVRVIDIVLLPEFRRKGIGAALLENLLREADGKEITVSLHVEYNNPILPFYERLGFRKIDTHGVYFFMKRPPSSGRAEHQKEKEAHMIEKLAISSFHPHVGDTFEIRTASGEKADLELVEITDTSTDLVDAFSLIFRGPADPVLSHDTHKVSHPGIGEFDLFLGPIVYGKTDGVYYQAVFSRFRPGAKVAMKAGKAAKKSVKKSAKKAAKKPVGKTVKKTVKKPAKTTGKKKAKKKK